MFSTVVVAFGLLAPLLPAVQAHGQIKGVMANGQYNAAPNIYYDGDSVNANTAIRKMFAASSPSYLNYWDFSDNSKMACESAGPAPKTIQVSAGSQLHIYWEGATSELLNQGGTGNTQGDNPWVHAMGPVSDYIASCNGDCSSFSAANAGWTKLTTWGLDTSQSLSAELRNTMNNKPEPYYPKGQGLWGMAKLVQDSSTWTVTIPQSLKNGQYLIRNELAAVHSPKSSGGGPQLYVGCVQVEVINGGDQGLPQGTLAGSLYETDGYLANFDVYSAAGSVFNDIGPAVWNILSGITSGSSPSSSSSSSGSSSSGSSSNSGSSSGSSSDSGSSSSSSFSGSPGSVDSGNSYVNPDSGSSPSSSSNSGSGSSSGSNNNFTTPESSPAPSPPTPASSPASAQRCKSRKRFVPSVGKRALSGHRDMRKRRLEY